MNITPENITSLKPNEIMVFGSNTLGIHGKGAALTAKRKFGAQQGIGEGITGQCYALPTKDERIKTLSLARIAVRVRQFLDFAARNGDKHFLVTAVGTGLAGHALFDIAPMFADALHMDNLSLPESFWRVLQKTSCIHDRKT